MLDLYVWRLGILLQTLLLLRGCWAGNVKRFPYFYVYIASGLLDAIVAYFIFVTRRTSFHEFYWLGEFVTLFFGCGLILEIFKHVLAPYPGAERFARILCLTTFGLIFLFGIASSLASSVQPANSEIDLERDVRTAQILFFLAILAVIAYYGVALGRNMRGMIFAYGLYLSASLITLALRSYLGLRFDAAWNLLEPLSFDVSLFLWLAALWSYDPNPLPDHGVSLEADYEAFASKTKQVIGSMRSHIDRTVR